jgi:hypothetical protein
MTAAPKPLWLAEALSAADPAKALDESLLDAHVLPLALPREANLIAGFVEAMRKAHEDGDAPAFAEAEAAFRQHLQCFDVMSAAATSLAVPPSTTTSRRDDSFETGGNLSEAETALVRRFAAEISRAVPR